MPPSFFALTRRRTSLSFFTLCAIHPIFNALSFFNKTNKNSYPPHPSQRHHQSLFSKYTTRSLAMTQSKDTDHTPSAAHNDNMSTEYYRSDGVRIHHDPYAPGIASKYGLPGDTDPEGFVSTVQYT
jgi:hypothetical protein